MLLSEALSEEARHYSESRSVLRRRIDGQKRPRWRPGAVVRPSQRNSAQAIFQWPELMRLAYTSRGNFLHKATLPRAISPTRTSEILILLDGEQPRIPAVQGIPERGKHESSYHAVLHDGDSMRHHDLQWRHHGSSGGARHARRRREGHQRHGGPVE